MIKFATPENTKQPKGGLVIEKKQERDYILGATGPEWVKLVADGQWKDYSPVAELQRNGAGDTFMCVSFSLNNIHEFLHKKQYNEEINASDIFLGVGSGTIRGRGNSKRAVAEWKRKNGFVYENEYPYTPEMSLDQVYAKPTTELITLAKRRLFIYEFGYKWLSSNSTNAMLDGLTYSPIQVDVQGDYVYGPNGTIIRTNWNDTHEVCVFGYEAGSCWYVFDSENLQYLRFAWDYEFSNPMIHYLKKTLNMKLYKTQASPAIYALDPETNTLAPFSDGSIAGGRVFKTIYGTTNYSDLPIKVVETLPYPVADWEVTTRDR